MFKTKSKVVSIAALTITGGLMLAGCSSNSMNNEPNGNGNGMSNSPSASPSASAEPAGMLVGPGCDDYAKMVPDGAGSVEGMSQDPVATAASNNPMLKTLTSAVSGELNPDVNLVDTLNSGEYTVFAPIDDAFAKVDAATLDTLKTDSDLLTKVLTYHVVSGQVAPDEIVGTHKTLEGSDLTVSGSGDELMVNDNSMVVCGGVETANATVYLVDSVLMPPMDSKE